jgi:pimeloyl-ACP methyl ester carboxylesterase
MGRIVATPLRHDGGMPTVERPDGAEVHWEERGEGPLVLIAHQVLWSQPGVYAELIADLARDRRVVTYDPRGCGSSTRRGPYDAGTDAGDLLAVIEAAGGPAVALAVGYGFNIAVRVAAARPDLIETVLSVQPAAAAVLPRSELRKSDVMAGSDSVMEMFMQMLGTDPRTALRTIVAATNPGIDEDTLRKRVAVVSSYISPEAAPQRAEVWLGDDPSEHVRALGARVWILHDRAEQLFEGALAARVAELYPEAHIEEVQGGPISRPDLVAERIRRAR